MKLEIESEAELFDDLIIDPIKISRGFKLINYKINKKKLYQ